MILLWLYAWLATLLSPLLRSNLRRRALAGKEIPSRLGERRGHDQAPRPRGKLIWLHAASVGETISILPVIERLLRLRPDVTILVTTGTVTSATLLQQRAAAFAPGRIVHRFVPLDVPRWTRRFLGHWRPDVAGFVESEIWPNLLRHTHRSGARLMLINGRMSDPSFRRWRHLPGTAARLMRLFDTIQAQSPADAARFTQLGARDVTAPGNLKFATPELPVDPVALDRLRHRLAGRPVWLAASTHPGEEQIAARIHRALALRHPKLLTIIVPRHPERGPAIAAELEAEPDPIPLTRRSRGQNPPSTAGIWLADTLGELGLLYRAAPIAFVGRSLTTGGGQNPIEPARLGCAVCVGPLTTNFIEPVRTLREAGALEIAANAEALQTLIDALLSDPLRVAAMAAAGQTATTGFSDLPDRVATDLLALLDRPA
jgi:3-deoxy-D-manno-octulosonic-acid transferase